MGNARGMDGRRRWWRLLVSAVVTVMLLGLDAGTSGATHSVEHRYEVPSVFPVSWDDGSPGGCDGPEPPPGTHTFVYPSAPYLGAFGDHPIVVWGNGTDTDNQGNAPCYYKDLLRLWASWGYVVVAANTGYTGSGAEMLAGARSLVEKNGDPDSVFHQTLDTGRVAVAGHSQGAVGAINATLDGDGLFDSVLLLSMPDRNDLFLYNLLCTLSAGFCKTLPIPADGATDDLGAPVFFARGTGLYLPAGHRCADDDWMSDTTAQDWYPDTPAPFLAGTVRVSVPADQALCDRGFPDASYPHRVLSDAFGYMNAWLAYTLLDQPGARPAFVGDAPEITTNTDWQGVTHRGLQ